MNKFSLFSSDRKGGEVSFSRLTPKQKNIIRFKRIHPLILVFPLVVVVTSFLYIFFLNYYLLILPKEKIEKDEQTISLFDKKILDSVYFFSKESRFHPFSKFIYLSLKDRSSGKKTGFILNFKKPLDLRGSHLLLMLKKSDKKFKIQTILKDKGFRSNALTPLETEVKPEHTSSPYQYVLIEIKKLLSSSNVDISKIIQLRLLFGENSSLNSSFFLIKDLFLRKERK